MCVYVCVCVCVQCLRSVNFVIEMKCGLRILTHEFSVVRPGCFLSIYTLRNIELVCVWVCMLVFFSKLVFVYVCVYTDIPRKFSLIPVCRLQLKIHLAAGEEEELPRFVFVSVCVCVSEVFVDPGLAFTIEDPLRRST
jgi:hypothetical protein